ncbi:MAG: DUF1236 domain-containing protein [Rhizobiales bacterium]|nr:DUF1236 domain-containing protein [Hyphomicrobiales bacterium]
MQRDRQGRQDSGDRTSARGHVDLNVQQRTRIRESVFARSDVPRVTSVNFNLAVGTVVPPRVRVMTVPEVIVDIRPEFRNHQYFVVRDEIVILDNRRHIVAVIPVDMAGGGGRAVRGGGADVAIDLSPDEIREVQLVLRDRGFSVEVDGVFGPRTRQALVQFQQRQGLQATGRIDNRTIAELGVSVRSGQQPSTTGRGDTGQSDTGQRGTDRGRGGQGGATQGSNEPRYSPKEQQSDETGATQQSGQSPSEPSTTGQGQNRGNDQRSPAKEGMGAGQGGTNNPSANPSPRGGDSSMPRGQSK